MEIEKLVDAFTDAARLGPIPAVEGVWRFSADGNRFGVMADESGENLWLFADVPNPPPDKEDSFRKTILEANFFGRSTGGAVFSLNPETGAYMLARSERLDRLAPESFFALVEKFVNTLASWNGLVAAAQGDEPSFGEAAGEGQEAEASDGGSAPLDEQPLPGGFLSGGFMQV